MATHGRPHVSVVLSTFNGGRYLRQAIESILAQTMDEFEFIIVNDGSTDDTAEILASYKDKRIVCLQNPRPKTLPAALNQAIAVARSEYITRMDGDDIATPCRLEKQIEYLERHPDVGVLGTQCLEIDADGNEIDRTRQTQYPTKHNMIVWRLFSGPALAHPSVVMRRSVLDKTGGYDADFPVSQDREFWIRCLPYTRFANLEEPLMYYRIHNQSASANRASAYRDLSFLPTERFYKRMSGNSVDLAAIKRIYYRRYRRTLHTHEDVQVTAVFLLELLQLLIDNGYLDNDDLSGVYRELSEMVIEMGRQSPQGLAFLANTGKTFMKWFVRQMNA